MKYSIQLNKTELPVFKRLLSKTYRVAAGNRAKYLNGYFPWDELGTKPEMILMHRILHYINTIEEEEHGDTIRQSAPRANGKKNGVEF